MTTPLLWSPYFESSVLSGVQLESVRNEVSKLGLLRRGFAWGFLFSFVGLLHVGVVFFPSLPFMGVVLFPSFVLGDVSGQGGTLLVALSLFSPLLSLPLLSSPSPSLSLSLLFFIFFFLISFFLFFLISFSFLPFLSPFSSSLFDAQTLSFPFVLLLLFSISFSFPLSFLRVFFFRELLVLFVSEM